jgi:hypothetical protein
MKIIKYIFFINFLIFLILNYFKKSLTIGEKWSDTHINSLIGLQKLIEGSIIQSKIDISIWYLIFIPILNTPILLILALFFLFLFIFIFIKY